jgi:hypothetical protein
MAVGKEKSLSGRGGRMCDSEGAELLCPGDPVHHMGPANKAEEPSETSL